MDVIAQTLEQAALGEPDRFLNLAAFPLLGQSGYHRDYITLGAGIESGSVRVREISTGGSVSELAVDNGGKEPVLVFEGEELVGAKQNRTANVTVLAPAGATTRIPVTCVEAGRWSDRGVEMAPSDRMHFSGGRRAKMRSVATSMEECGLPGADQGAVWSDIESKSRRMRVSSRTSAMSDVYESHATRLDDYVRAFEARPGQTGVVFAINDRVEGLELFDCPETMADMLPKLIRSYAIDALETVARHRNNPTENDARDFVTQVRTAAFDVTPALGAGTEVRTQSSTLVAAGLVADGRVVHLAAFASPAEGEPAGSSLARMRSRRSGMRR